MPAYDMVPQSDVESNLWVSDMLLVDTISRARIEEIVAHLLKSS